jgi:hypothetical protein
MRYSPHAQRFRRVATPQGGDGQVAVKEKTREASASFFEKKEAKKLSLTGGCGAIDV